MDFKNLNWMKPGHTLQVAVRKDDTITTSSKAGACRPYAEESPAEHWFTYKQIVYTLRAFNRDVMVLHHGVQRSSSNSVDVHT